VVGKYANALRRRRSGASTIEYVLVLALIVIPLAIMTWLLVKPMLSGYVNRYTTVVRTPLG
jgi:Flp pilus assembly pilin Flp